MNPADPARPMPPAILSPTDKLWIVLAHLSPLFGLGLVFPLIVYVVQKDHSSFVAWHAREALNFHLSLLIYSLGCFLLMFIVIGFPLFLALCVAALVLAIIAAVRGAEGREYRYPLTLRLVN